jgi:alkanesulfonate monooxygenase SsuD/methylene tetrahydromethanopterin reductase-like flavin-dependent oxidoreductase (luciferase family)
MPASSGYGLQAAVMYADIIIAMPSSIEEGRAQRQAIRQAAAQAGRNPEDIKYLAFAGFTIGDTERHALDTRLALDAHTDIRGPLARLSAYLGLQQQLTRPDEPLTTAQLTAVQAHPQDARSIRAVELAHAGWSPRDILAHAVFDPYPSVVGTAGQVADHLQEWFKAGAADGFMLNFDDFSTEIGNFVEQVIPVLRERGIFQTLTRVKPSATTWECHRSTDSTPASLPAPSEVSLCQETAFSDMTQNFNRNNALKTRKSGTWPMLGTTACSP